jgi:uncharacterized protein with beta-barrel porin domain
VSTDRYLNFAGNDHLTSAFSAHDIAGRIEIGNRYAVPDMIGWPGYVGVTPYAALQVQAFYTPSYSENAAGGSSVFALAYAAQTTTTIRTELGAWYDRNLPLYNGAVLALRARTAWAHDQWAEPATAAAAFQSLPGSNFTVFGAAPVPNSLLASGGAELRFINGFSVATWFDGEFANRSQTYTGKARLSYRW